VTLAKHKTPAIAPKIKQAIARLLSQERYDLAEAARAGGISTERLRANLSLPHVRSYMRAERQLQIEAICQSNPAALAKLRDEGSNQVAVVNGIRILEAMRKIAIEEFAGPARREPGLVILIAGDAGGRDARIEPASAPRVIDGGACVRRPDPDDDLLAGRPRRRRG
jgi:hypothetical protein